jgi:hypothetical protein
MKCGKLSRIEQQNAENMWLMPQAAKSARLVK